MTDLLLALLAYFIGAFPTAFLFGRLLKKADIRRLGSGNVGALNTFKNIGYLPGLLTLAVDIAKGSLAVYLALQYGNHPQLPVLAAFMAILGHNFNLFLGFKGGKGLGCLIGSLLLISPVTILYLFAFIAILVLILRDTNTAAGLGIIALPLILGLHKDHWIFYLAGTAMAILIMVKHLKDFRAYRDGRRKFI